MSLALGVYLAAFTAFTASGCGASPKTSTTVPGSPLVIRSRTLHFSANLNTGLRLKGTVYPGLPSYSRPYTPNTIQASVIGARGRLRNAVVRLTGHMAGMHMRPIRVVLKPTGGSENRFSGRIAEIPMFGLYVFTVRLTATGTQATGTGSLNVSI